MIHLFVRDALWIVVAFIAMEVANWLTAQIGKRLGLTAHATIASEDERIVSFNRRCLRDL